MPSFDESMLERHTASPTYKDPVDIGTAHSTSTSNSTSVSNSDNHNDHIVRNNKDEENQYPPTTTTSQPHPQPSHLNTTSLRRYLKASISPTSHRTTILLLGLALATGINDAATFIDYHLFVSNQTGNTVFLGVGALNHDTIFDLRHVGLSLGLFLAGGLVSGQIGTWIAGKRERWWVVLSNAVQTVMMFTAAALRRWYATRNDAGMRSDPRSDSVISLLAFASGMQVALARGLGVPEIPTGMITSAWIDLLVDEKLWCVWRRNASRDRRLGFILCILVGGFIGAAASVYCAPALPLLLAACVKGCVTVGFAFGKVEGSTGEEIDTVQEKKEAIRNIHEGKDNGR